MILDAHSHFISQSLVCNLPFYRSAWYDTVERDRLRAGSEIGGELLTYPVAPLLAHLSPDDQLAAIRLLNDQAAELVQRNPGKVFGSICVYPPLGADIVLAEIRRARSLGLYGISLSSRYGDAYLDHPVFEPVYRWAAETGEPLLIHPNSSVEQAPSGMKDYHLMPVLGFVFENSLSITRLIFSGTLDRFPSLRIITTHLGGVLPFLAGRLDSLAAAFGEQASLKMRPSAYLAGLYFDTCTSQVSALQCSLAVVSSDHLLLGTDFPAVLNADDMVRAVRSLGLGPGEEAAILGGNLQRLLSK